MLLQLPPIKEVPFVSILISSYNHAEYIEEAIETAIHQSYSNIEAIVCDDGSTDNSRAILDTLQKDYPYKLTVLKKENGGQASAINAAFQKCSGEIICFLDSDDFFHTEKVQHVVDAFKNNPETGFLIHRLDKVDRNGHEFGQLPISPKLPSGDYSEFVINTGSAPIGFPVTSGLILRREIASRLFPFNEKIFYDLDEIIRRLALLITKVGHINKSLGTYRIHGKNVTETNVQSRLKIMLPIYKVMWNETKKYIENIYPKEADKFPKLEHDLHYLLMNYVLTRLNHKFRESDNYWDRIKENNNFASWSLARRGFWIIAAHAPDFLFNRMIAYYWGPNGLKLKLSKIQSQFRYFFRNDF